MTFWNSAVIVVLVLLLLYLLWQEVRRLNKTWLTARVVASLLAVAGLAGMALPFTYSKKIEGSSTTEAVVLTEGYHPDSLQSFLAKNSGVRVFTLMKEAAPNNATFLPDISFLNDDTSHLKRVHLFGNGLNEDELAAITTIPFYFHPSTTNEGFTAISWSQQLTSGDVEKVQGRYTNASGTPVKLVLDGFGTALDSAVIPARQTVAFQLQTAPRHIGRAVYSLFALQNKDTLAKEPLPIEVISPKPIKTLLLAAYPDFENKFLKNWLVQNGYSVAVRTRISKNKFATEYSNLSGVEIKGITSALLNRFDVVIADAAELSAISPSEAAALQSAVSQQGIGLVVKADSITSGNRFYASGFPLLREQGHTPVTMHLHFTADAATLAVNLKTVQPMYIRPLPGTQPLIQTDKGQTVVSAKLQGRGKVLLTTLNNTYTWQLAGNEENYTTVWSALLQQAAKKEALPELFYKTTALPVADEKTAIRLQTAYPEPPQVLAASTAISMEQNYQLPFLWKGFYWPKQAGWVPFTTQHQTVSWQYFFGKNDWQTARAETKKRLTGSRAISKTNTSVEKETVAEKIETEIPKGWFFLLFLLSATFLWFERKYQSG